MKQTDEFNRRPLECPQQALDGHRVCTEDDTKSCNDCEWKYKRISKGM